ncbi:MAG TPA: CBS domain-containing protein [Pyrinomonadaceae bacterium]|jgi:CBS domain-containing protein|nr:CBS domain-containing protein [Pyrinomonadaceae bacterium]
MNCPSCGHENIDGIDRCENCLAPFRQLDIPSADAAEGLARSVMEDNLKQLDRDEVIYTAPDATALEVARLMKNSNTGCALVIDGNKLVGIFTEHDVLLKMTADAAGGRALSPGDIANIPIKALMSPDPETLDETNSVAEALNKMSLGRYRHIPFKKADGSYAVASIKSVLKYIAQEDW